MKATWLYSKHPLVVDVDLASVIGLNEAIILQQLNYWLHSKSAKPVNGKTWIYNSMKSWHQQFPFWSLDTIKRAFEELEKMNLIETGNFNKLKFDRTKWYSINEKELSKRMKQSQPIDLRKTTNALGQNAPMEQRNLQHSEWGNLHQPIPDTTETTTETNTYSRAKPDSRSAHSTHLAERKEIIAYLNNKLGTSYRAGAKKNAERMNARLNEGYTVDDFKKVIDNKYADWADSPKMARYLRPETLFSPKFEGYLNEKQVTSGNQDEPDYEASLREWNEGD